MKKSLSFLIVAAGVAASGVFMDGSAMSCDVGLSDAGCAAVVAGSEKTDELPPLSREETKRVREAAAKVDPKLKAEFDRLHSAWYRAADESAEISMSSAVGERRKLPQFQALVDLGPGILPLVVEQMLEPDRFFTLTVYEALSGTPASQEAWCQKCARQYVKDWLAAN